MGAGCSSNNRVTNMEEGEDDVDSEDSAASKQWKHQRASIQRELPSSQIHNSELGTALSRNAMTKERAKKLADVDLPSSHSSRPTTAHAMELRLMKEVNKRGIHGDMDGDGIVDELDRLKQIEIIREMPVSLKWKRQMREKLYATMPDYDSAGCSQWFYKRKVKAYMSRKKGRKQWRELSQYFVLWGSAMAKIEGNHGSGVLTYFTFLRWLFFVNFFIFICSFVFVVVPQVAFPTAGYNKFVIGNSSSSVIDIVETCSANYVANITIQTDAANLILNFIEGTGWMENTVMFYGFYVNKAITITSEYEYNLPLAYLLTTLFYILFSLILIVRKTSAGFEARLFTTASASHQFCNLLFGTAWDYNVTKVKAASLRHKSFNRSITGELEEKRRQLKLRNRTTGEKCKLYTIRLFINLIVFVTLCGAGYVIYFTTIKTVELTGNTTWYYTQHTAVKFLIQYMTSLTITVLNAILPTLYKLIVRAEDFSPSMAVSITLFRTVFLKLASLAILLVSIFTEITCSEKDECRIGYGSCSSISGGSVTREVIGFQCWETKVGQEIYKLVVMDFFVLIGVTFAVELPRWLIATRCSCKLVKPQEFDVAKEVLKLIYGQTLLWLGTFFSPMIPVLVILKNIIGFYVKYLSTMVFYGPSSTPHSSSDSDAFFMYVLLCAYSLCVIPIGYCVWMIPPSRSCGPFRIYDKMFDIVNIIIETWPVIIDSIIDFIQSSIFELTAITVLAVAIYYLSHITSAYKGMIRVLKEQLVMENYDKKFLLAKLHDMESAGPPKATQYKES